MDDQPDPKLLESVDEGKRASLKKLLLGSAFAIPVIASFTMSGLGVNEAHASVFPPNSTQGHHHHKHEKHHHKHHKHHHEHHHHKHHHK
ncbi:MAG: hypothetical protein ABSD96_08925 [Candidatus Korobacteraceae bacterium]|jgi:hypothetical protein